MKPRGPRPAKHLSTKRKVLNKHTIYLLTSLSLGLDRMRGSAYWITAGGCVRGTTLVAQTPSAAMRISASRIAMSVDNC